MKRNPALTERARELRREQTRAEEILWRALRGRRLAGLKFRRQHPFGRFVLDFYCAEHPLAVEVDGSVHARPTQIAHDAARTRYLRERGLRVVRFNNDEIEANLDAVLRQILDSVT